MQIRGLLLVWLASLGGLLVVPAEGRRSSTRNRLARGLPTSHAVHERHEKRHLEGWVKRDLVDEDLTVPVRIGLRQENLERGHDLLMEISNPRSPRTQSVEKVKRWLVEAGVDERRLSQSPNKQWIQFDAPVHEVEDLLLTEYHVYENADTGLQSIACSQYHVPHNVSHHIDYITPGVKLGTGDYDDKIVKRMIGRRSLIGDLPRKGRKGGKGKGKGKAKVTATEAATGPVSTSTAAASGNRDGPVISADTTAGAKGRLVTVTTPSGRRVKKCRPKDPPEPEHPGELDPMFLVTGPCQDELTPQCIRVQYQIPNNTRATKGNELGIFQSLNQHYSQEDLDNYWKHVTRWVPHGTHPELRAINGAYGPTNDTSKAGDEADLDFQIAIPLVWPQKTVLFQTDDEWYQRDQQRAETKYPGFFNTFWDALDGSYCTLEAFNMTGNCKSAQCRDPEYPNPNASPHEGAYHGPLMCGAYRPTNVISISYSGTEHSWPANYIRRQCFEIMKLALQGVTVVESSGDFGVGGRMWDPHGGCLGRNRTVFSPRVLGNCPYVLSVGATALAEPEYYTPGETPKLREVAAEMFASGGGFSNVFERPAYQDRHVREYFERANISHMGYEARGGQGFAYINPPPGPGKLFNMAGRGYPDVSALGENFRVVLRGYPNRMHGTSASTPIWASILTLINEERLARGKSTVGFVHPVLYAHPEVFNDITEGSNPGCGSDGFPVKEGWDPVTGLGSPNYPKLLELFLSLP
ncbi:hypothetical protein VTJ49DRAFT_3158 [Mycothermus thermophilus]|uniref:Peptidase S53 domain-containing protein n=1 Tax=Humicola insolens TaxID=85995 RepID=A0ABR3V866_HUMIN